VKTTTLTATLAAGSFAVLGLAGCSAQTTAGAETSAPAAGASAASDASFADGDYSATGHYDSPGGASAVAVALTLKSGVVTALKVVPKAENPTAQQYEAKFASGVNALVVGKKLSEVNVTTVSGSSLTSQGFDAAITQIEGKAKA
jgi:uncharacterized protein with FMN-binding domain